MIHIHVIKDCISREAVKRDNFTKNEIIFQYFRKYTYFANEYELIIDHTIIKGELLTPFSRKMSI